MDLIERQAAIDVLEERLQANGYSNVALVSELNRSIGYLMQLPSAQPEHGRWIEQKHGDWRFSKEFRCSECGKYRLVTTPAGWEWRYCPNCGAKMDGESNEDRR